MVQRCMKYRVENKQITIIFAHLHEALGQMNKMSHAKLTIEGDDSILDENPDEARRAAQRILSNLCDFYHMEHIKLEDLLSDSGPHLVEQIKDCMNRERILNYTNKCDSYTRALTYFLMIYLMKERRGSNGFSEDV